MMQIRGAPQPDDNGQLPPPPPHVHALEALRLALPALRPPSRIDVAAAAEAFRMVNAGGHWEAWSNEVAPYMVEPMRMITSRRFTELYFAGPARSVKTAGLIENAIAHAIVCNPRTVHVTQMTGTAARTYAIEKIEPLILNSPELRARLGRRRTDNNIQEKRFSGGMSLTIGAPTVAELASRDIPLMLMTDVDRYPLEIGSEGCPIALGRKRPATFGSAGMLVAESSPGRDVTDETAELDHAHAAPKTTGILAYYDDGTRGRFYWQCPGCAERFEPSFERLHFDADLEPAAAGAGAVMVCPHNGCVIRPEMRAELNAGGVWLHQARDGGICKIDGDVRPSKAVSYWLKGPAAVFAPWSDIVARVLAAREKARKGSDAELRAVTNTDLAEPYIPGGLGEGEELSAEALYTAAPVRPLGVAPAGTAFLTVSVDVQKHRFVVQVDAWARDLERWVIDRYDIVTPPTDAPRAARRALDPAAYVEDWQVLAALEGKAYPVEGADYALLPVSIGVDSGGRPGVAPKAYAWYRGRRAAQRHGRWRIIKGWGGFDKPRAEVRKPERAHGIAKKHGAGGRRAQAAQDIPILWVGTDPVKDEIDASLRREDPGARAIHLSRELGRTWFGELTCERRQAVGWRAKAGNGANEAWDLLGYGLAQMVALGAERIDWDAPPIWARADQTNRFAVIGDVDPDPAPEPAAETAAPARRRARPRRVVRRPRGA